MAGQAGRGAGRGQAPRSASSQHTPTVSGSGTKRANKWANNDQSNGVAGKDGRPQAAPLDEASAKRMHDRMLFLTMSLIGAKVVATVREGAKFEGILSSATSEGEVNVALKHVRNLADADDVPTKPTLLILAKDLVSLHAADIDLEKRATAASASTSASDTFRTDTDISGAGTSGDRRLLQKWSAPADAEPLGLEDAKHGPSGGGWDQFAVNERMFGSRTNYNEELYTTKLDRTSADYKARERKADRLAAEILSGSSSNAHVLEERNANASGKEGDEEDRYGAVIRGPNAYVPPAARTAQQGNKTNGDVSPADYAASPNGKLPSTSPLSIKQPSQILATSSALQSGSVNAESSSSLNQLMPDLKHFVQTEKERVVAKRQAQAKKEKETKLAELANWSKSFQLKGEIPTDLMPILAKDPDKQRVLQDRSKDPPAGKMLLDSKPGATSLSADLPVEPARAKLTAAALSAANAAAGRSGEPALPGVGPKVPRNDKAAGVSRDSIAQIPPFNALKRGLSGATSPAPSAPSPAPSSAALPAAAAAAKLNPNVVAFVPGMSSAAPPAAAPALSRKATAEEQPVASTSANPFFGSRSIKRGSSGMQVKEDFTPFRVTSSTPLASSIPDSWGFQGKSTRDQAVAILSSLPAPMPPEEAMAMMGQQPGTPQAVAPMPAQGGPPPFSVFRYPPQFVYAGQQPFSGAPATPYSPQFVGPGGFSQAGIPHQGYAPVPNQAPTYLPVFRGVAGQPGQPPMFFPQQIGQLAPQQMGQLQSPPPVQFRRLSSASSGGQASSPFPPTAMR